MYKCKIHGELKTEWCDECKKIVQCDCSDADYQKISGLHYDTNQGERSLEIKVIFCATCGKLSGVEEWGVR